MVLKSLSVLPYALPLFLTLVRGYNDWVPIRVETEAGQVTGRLGGGVMMDHCAFVPWMKEAPGAPNVASFYGIPYAEEPTGPLRFAPPKPRVPFGELNATTLPPICPQEPLPLPPWAPHWLPGFSTNEDCLTLNVWTKAPFEQSSARPVLVFIHGGAFIQGNGYTDLGCAFYNGNPIAADAGLVVRTCAHYAYFIMLEDMTVNLQGIVLFMQTYTCAVHT